MSPLMLLVLTVALAAPTPGEALLEEGLRAYDDMDLDRARASLAQARDVATSEERPRIDLWLGIVEIERGRDDDARRWLRSALRVSPRLAVSREVSPKILATIDAVRAEVLTPDAPAARPPEHDATVRPALRTAAGTTTMGTTTMGTTATATDTTSTTSTDTNLPADPDVGRALTTAPAAAARTGPSTAPPPPTVRGPTVAAGVAAVAAPASPAGTGGESMPPLLVAGATSGALALAAVGTASVFGVMAHLGGEAARHEERAALATERYAEANAAALTANSLFVAGGVAAAVGATCGAVWLADGAEP